MRAVMGDPIPFDTLKIKVGTLPATVNSGVAIRSRDPRSNHRCDGR